MGWVPVDGGMPAFIVGDSVVVDPAHRGSVSPGVHSNLLHQAQHFGVGETEPGDWGSADYRNQVRLDFVEIVEAYILSDAWTDPGTAALVLAGALRPCLPLRPRATMFFWGPKNRGKSWSARTMMYFWQRHKRDWLDDLPGSAKDTVAFLENAVSLAPIWVVDDLVPSTSIKQAESEMAKLEDLTRAIFNNAAKGRMNSDMTSQRLNKPVAQLIITAENELATPSAKERLLPAYLGAGKLHPDRERTDRINDLASLHGTQARFTGHVLSFIRFLVTSDERFQGEVGGPSAWSKLYEWLESERTKANAATRKYMKDEGIVATNTDRVASLAADIGLSFAVLSEMAHVLEMPADVRELFTTGSGLSKYISMRAADAHSESQSTSLGQQIVKGLILTLSAGHAHIVAGADPLDAPMQDDGGRSAVENKLLGWSASGGEGTMRPNGPTIGYLGKYNKESFVFFDPDIALGVVQKHFRQQVNHGVSSKSVWTSVWDDLLVPLGMEKPKNSRGTTTTILRGTKVHGFRPNGVPIPLDMILMGGTEE